jgi:HlyD family secretion protein
VVEQNVVSYVTTIAVPNPDLALKPGMTANVTIEVERASRVLRVPNAALRVHPTAEVFVAFDQTPPDVVPAQGHPNSLGGAATRGQGGRHGEVWIVHDGLLTPVPVVTGTSDASHTAVMSGDLDEGVEVVTGISTPGAATSTDGARTRSPLLPAPRRPGGVGTAPRPR